MLRKPTATPAQLAQGLAELGLDGSQNLIVHASLRSFGRFEGGARSVVDVLANSVDTLVAPSFTYQMLLSRPDSYIRVQLERYSRVSRDIGAISQAIVDRPEAQRSFHPVLSFIATGSHAADITTHQALDNPYLPIGALYDLDGYALLMGVGFDSNTSVHYGEYLAGIPQLVRYVPLDRRVMRSSFPNCSADFDHLEQRMCLPVRQLMVGQSTLRLYRVRDLVDSTIQLLAQEPTALLCKNSHCRCQEVRQNIRFRYGELTQRSHVPLIVPDTDTHAAATTKETRAEHLAESGHSHLASNNSWPFSKRN